LSFVAPPPLPGSTLFPTRRSSDLGSRARIRSVVVRRCSASRPSAASRPVASTSASFRGDLSVIILPPLPNAPRNGRFSPTSLSRSEEHTSELQSRENLVCRLLLEK